MQSYVLNKKGTEPPFSRPFVEASEGGYYSCVACGNVIFNSDKSFESITPGLIGWPSFSEAVSSNAVRLKDDYSFGMYRIEVCCGQCGGHLGHYFDDPAAPDGAHYCINACVLAPSEVSQQGNHESTDADSDSLFWATFWLRSPRGTVEFRHTV